MHADSFPLFRPFPTQPQFPSSSKLSNSFNPFPLKTVWHALFAVVNGQRRKGKKRIESIAQLTLESAIEGEGERRRGEERTRGRVGESQLQWTGSVALFLFPSASHNIGCPLSTCKQKVLAKVMEGEGVGEGLTAKGERGTRYSAVRYAELPLATCHLLCMSMTRGLHSLNCDRSTIQFQSHAAVANALGRWHWQRIEE